MIEKRERGEEERERGDENIFWEIYFIVQIYYFIEQNKKIKVGMLGVL